jgi:hypothetical protein
LLLGEVVELVLALLPLRLAHLRRRRRDFPARGWGLGFWRCFCSELRRRLGACCSGRFCREGSVAGRP